MKRFLTIALLAASALLGGCAGMRIVDSQVTAIASAPVGMQLQGARYRFERLPSQMNSADIGMAEQQAEQAMAAVGLVRDDANAQLSVLVGLHSSAYLYDPYGRSGLYPWRPAGSLTLGRGGYTGWGWGMHMPPVTDYRREVSLILRDLRSGQVVYETRASHYGVWNDSEAIFATLFKAALANFPNPPAGVQRVNIEIPR
jgi:hypothetical protein